MAYLQIEVEMAAGLADVLNKVVQHQQDYAVQLWEFGKTLIDLDLRGLPTVFGEEADTARRMNLRHFNTEQEVRSALPIPKPIFGGIPPNDYYIKLEDWLGLAAVSNMRQVLALIQKEIEPIWKREGYQIF